MRAFCATAALCLAAAFVPSAHALAHARHHHAQRDVPPAATGSFDDLFPIQKRLFMHPESAGGRQRMEQDGHGK